MYKRQHAFVILAEKVAQRKALSAAFTLLDISADGHLSLGEFQPLLRALNPRARSEEEQQRQMKMLFDLVDKVCRSRASPLRAQCFMRR